MRSPALPDHHSVLEPTSQSHPYRLVTAPARHFLNSSFTETPSSRRREQYPTLMMHPTDAARDGLVDDGWVKVGNARGAVSLRLECFDGLQPGVVICESLWPNDAFPEGLGINVLTGADPAGPAGGAAFHDNSVWVRRA